ncbi:hypothetical protein AVEN_183555-1 [Araneus ventricosus]|uniref:Helitron helicase-like domain-containing protein n=1 Tax=Araneus ventricosus TaxID=182803 RepID=A0A4Y2FIN5_ARAVE|nr:hypothetical protein AVEN_183555-1 [Araneus ventricosus]
MSLATELNLISREVECHSLKNCINPSEGLLEVFFHTELQQAVNKADTVPALMKQMALQLINEIPGVDIQIYTDESKNEENQSGSGIYIKTPREVRKIKLRNPDNCSVFRSELLAIEAGLEAILNENNYGAVWILSDSVDHEVHLQWIPSHVDIYGNEVADNLAKQGTAKPLCSTPSLTLEEIYSIRKNKDLKTWRVPPSHDWYKRSSPGGSIGLACDRADQTALSRFVSGHLRSCSFSHGNKVFPVCAKCGVASASPEHILSCLRLSREIFETDPLLALDFLRVEGNRLNFIRHNQRHWNHINALATEAEIRPGVTLILPSSFIGSPREIQQNFQYVMSIVRDFGKPDLFLTFTCNPEWKEIKDNLFPGKKPHDRPDLVDRVFDIKKKALLQDLKKNDNLGRIVADIHVIEFQKRGLPHMHLLLI